MKVYLTVAREGYSAGMTVDLPPATARALIFDGHARVVGEEQPIRSPRSQATTKNAPAKKTGENRPRPRRRPRPSRTEKE